MHVQSHRIRRPKQTETPFMQTTARHSMLTLRSMRSPPRLLPPRRPIPALPRARIRLLGEPRPVRVPPVLGSPVPREALAVFNNALEPARPDPEAQRQRAGKDDRAQGEREPEDEGAPEQVEELEREEEHDEEQGERGEGGRGGDEGVELRRG